MIWWGRAGTGLRGQAGIVGLIFAGTAVRLPSSSAAGLRPSAAQLHSLSPLLALPPAQQEPPQACPATACTAHSLQAAGAERNVGGGLGGPTPFDRGGDQGVGTRREECYVVIKSACSE